MTAMRMAANLAAIATENVQLLEREHRALEEIKSSEERFRALIENATDLILVLNPDGMVRYVSPSVVQILGFAPDEIIGRSIADFVHSDELPAALDAIAIRVQTPGVADQASEFRVRHKDGSYHTMEVIGNNLLDNPAISGIVVNARDVTERKQADETLRKKDEHHKAVIESIFKFVPEGVLVLTESMNLMKHNMAFDDIVQKYAPLLGYTEEKLAEKIIEQLRSKILSGDTTEIHIPKKSE